MKLTITKVTENFIRMHQEIKTIDGVGISVVYEYNRSEHRLTYRLCPYFKYNKVEGFIQQPIVIKEITDVTFEEAVDGINRRIKRSTFNPDRHSLVFGNSTLKIRLDTDILFCSLMENDDLVSLIRFNLNQITSSDTGGKNNTTVIGYGEDNTKFNIGITVLNK